MCNWQDPCWSNIEFLLAYICSNMATIVFCSTPSIHSLRSSSLLQWSSVLQLLRSSLIFFIFSRASAKNVSFHWRVCTISHTNIYIEQNTDIKTECLNHYASMAMYIFKFFKVRYQPFTDLLMVLKSWVIWVRSW